jgi:catechol 2,3-dioxygenase-like lactoylglutathione lyase family enzyme
MGTVKVTRTLHHSVNVEGRLAESVEFYRRLLELPDEARPTIFVDGHWFAAGGIQLHLVDGDAGHEAIKPTGPHVCFAVEDLDAAIAELERDGIPYTPGAQGPVVQIWFVDPAGNTIEIQQDPAVVPDAVPPAGP